MAKQFSEDELEALRRRGAGVQRLSTEVSVPELRQMFEAHQATMTEKMARWEKNHSEKMAKFDELIKAIQVAGNKRSGAIDTGPIMKLIGEMQREHKELVATMATEKERCAYKLTGRRDQRGLIDLEYGLTFTPVDE